MDALVASSQNGASAAASERTGPLGLRDIPARSADSSGRESPEPALGRTPRAVIPKKDTPTFLCRGPLEESPSGIKQTRVEEDVIPPRPMDIATGDMTTIRRDRGSGDTECRHQRHASTSAERDSRRATREQAHSVGGPFSADEHAPGPGDQSGNQLAAIRRSVQAPSATRSSIGPQ